jgi:zinc transport system substrate-binding protein
MDTSKMKIVRLMDGVDVVEEEIVEGMEDDAIGIEPEYDEHIWTSPKNAERMVQAIANALCEADSAKSKYTTSKGGVAVI